MTMETTPNTIRKADKSPAMPVLLIKSICVSLINLILNTQGCESFSGRVRIKNGSSNEYRREHGNQDAPE